VTASGSIGTDTHEYIVNLTGVPNASHVNVTLNGVTDSVPSSGNVGPVRMDALLGAVNQDGCVLSGDYTAVRQKSGAPVDGNTFKFDINADGFILSGDYTTVRQQSGAQLP